MKQTYTLILSIFIAVASQAQNPIPNASFENWPVSTSPPTGWIDLQGGGTLTQVAGYAGSNAVKGSVVVSGPTYTPWISTDTVSGGFVDSLKFTCLRFWYKVNLAFGGGGQDVMIANIAIKNSSGGNVVIYPAGTNKVTANATNWTLKQIPLSYSGTPVKAVISFTVQPQGSDPYAHVGTWFIVDSVSFGCGVVGINEIEESSILNIYPNPVKSTLHFEIPASQSMKIRISDAIGNVVLQRNTSNPVNGFIKEFVNVESLSSGVYFLMLTSDKKTILRRLIVD